MEEDDAVVTADEIRVALQKGRRWSAWKLNWSGSGRGGRASGPTAVDCDGVERALWEELHAFFQDFSVSAMLAGETGDRMALRVSIVERASARSVQRRTNRIYLLYFLRSDLVLASTMKAEYATYLKHALCCALDCNAISDRGLRGRNIDALKELVLAPACTQDLLDAVLTDDAATMGRPAAHRQTLDEDEEADTAVRGGAAIIDEDVLRHKKRSAQAPSVREHKSAPLEHISIRVVDKDGEEMIKVTFRGPDALQGVRDLVEGGLMTNPPEQLRNLLLGVGEPCNEITVVQSAS